MPGQLDLLPGQRPEHCLSVARASAVDQASPRARPGHAVRVKVPGGFSSLFQRPTASEHAVKKHYAMQAPTRLLTKKVDMPGSRLERYSGQVCATVILTIGIACGLLLKEDTGMSEPWNSIGEVSGWMYFAAWSLSFYPQLLSNWRRKSVVGWSFDFGVTNVLGFGCLSVYYCAFHFDSSVRRKYREAHHGAESAVRANDVLFALHALLLTSLTLAQIGFYERGGQRVSPLVCYAVGLAMLVVTVYAGLLMVAPTVFSALAFLYLLSYIKVGVTASKYVPQALLNYNRKSTVGFSIGQMILDLTGGMLSLFQLVLEAVVTSDISVVTGDPVKLCLALLSIGYDGILMYQHYVLYADAGKKPQSPTEQQEDAESLLPDAEHPIVI